jgi:isovaleryl-CoA dehydrogenase
MQSALDIALEYTHTREQFGQKIATFQLMQGKLAGQSATPSSRICGHPLTGADMYTKLSASRAYVYAVARACDQGDVSRQARRKHLFWYESELIRMQDCAGAILYASDRAVEVAMDAQQCLVSNLPYVQSCLAPTLSRG